MRELKELAHYMVCRHTVLRKELFAHRRELILWTSWGLLIATVNVVIVWYGGYLNIVGRIKDLVIRGGENVYPREVEEFLYGHPAIADVQVIGVPDARYGEELMAWIRMREGEAPLTVDDVRSFCQGRLAHYKVPRYVHIVDEFPMTVTGKVRKVEMREQAVDLLGLHAAAATKHA